VPRSAPRSDTGARTHLMRSPWPAITLPSTPPECALEDLQMGPSADSPHGPSRFQGLAHTTLAAQHSYLLDEVDARTTPVCPAPTVMNGR